MISYSTSAHQLQSFTSSECIRGAIMNSFSKSAYELKMSILLIIYFDNLRDMWSKEKASAKPRYIFLES